MDAVSVAASIIGIATAGIQISIKLITLSTQISFASERVSSIANDVSLTSGVLHQLGDLMTQKSTEDNISIFSKGGLETTQISAALCERIFVEIEKELGRASEQLQSCRKVSGGRIKLSKSEKLKWPFLQPNIDILRADLRDTKGTLMLMLQVMNLALSKKLADLNATASNDQGDTFRAIVALQRQQERWILERQNQKSSDSLPTHAKSLLLEESDSELSMFMLIPIVKDCFDKIELSWSIQTPKLHVSAIRNHLARMEAEGLPSAMDMLENLYDHEHSVINTYQCHGELLSLKRTKTDIQHRDIVFKGVPGLQFVVKPKAKPTELTRLRRTARINDTLEHITLRGRGSQQRVAAEQHGSGLKPMSEAVLKQAKEELKASKRQASAQDEQKSVVGTRRPSDTTEESPKESRPGRQTSTGSSRDSLDVNVDSAGKKASGDSHSWVLGDQLSDPNSLENFDFEQHLQGPAFKFDPADFQHESTAGTGEDYERPCHGASITHHEEYFDDEDEVMTGTEAEQEADPETEKRIVERLLDEYTTLHVQLPRGQ